MKYINAEIVLPKDLLEKIQNYVQGSLIYIPKESERSPWGENSGTRKQIYIRNKEIIKLFKSGYKIEQLADKFYLSKHTIRKIISINKTGDFKYMIRELNNKEIDIIMDIWKDTTIKAHDFIPKDYWEKSYDVVKNTYIPMADTFVYEDKSGIKGFISIINGEFIGALFVNINNQGLGIGKELINYALKKYGQLDLAVYKDNKKSVEFYLNRGFSIIKEQPNEDSGFNEYIMQLKL